MRKKVEITKDHEIGLKKGEIKNLDFILANRLIKNGFAKEHKRGRPVQEKEDKEINETKEMKHNLNTKNKVK